MGIEVAILAVAAVGTAVSYSQSRKAAAQQKEANEISKGQQQAEALRQRRQVARKARVRRAQILQASENVGASGSSAEFGAVSGIASKQAGATSYLAGKELATTAYSNKMQSAADAQFRAQTASSISSLALSSSGYLKNTNGG